MDTQGLEPSQMDPLPTGWLELLAFLRRQNPFLTRLNVFNLRSFLMGFAVAQHAFGNHSGFRWLSDFQRWVNERFETYGMAWEYVIFSSAGTEADEIKMFWELCDEFCQLR